MQSRHLEHRKAVILGTVRNGASTVLQDIDRLETALGGFSELFWVIIESDSQDDTVEILNQRAAQDERFTFISCGALSDTYPHRVSRIAYCRELALRTAWQTVDLDASDIIVIADLDGVNDVIDRAGIESCFGRDDWAVCAANPAGPYYDIFALRHPTWCPQDCLEQQAFLISHGVDKKTAKFVSVFSRMITIPSDADWIEVDSAFGGLALYKAECTKSVRYYQDRPSETECEHVALHKAIRAQGHKIFINPALNNTSVNEHSSNAMSYMSGREHALAATAALLKKF